MQRRKRFPKWLFLVPKQISRWVKLSEQMSTTKVWRFWSGKKKNSNIGFENRKSFNFESFSSPTPTFVLWSAKSRFFVKIFIFFGEEQFSIDWLQGEDQVKKATSENRQCYFAYAWLTGLHRVVGESTDTGYSLLHFHSQEENLAGYNDQSLIWDDCCHLTLAGSKSFYFFMT